MSARHAKEPPTREKVFWPQDGTEQYQEGYHTGWRINADAEHAYIELYVPHDFHSLDELKLVLIALATASPMTLTVDADWAKEGEACTIHGRTRTASFNTITNQMYEVDIMELLDLTDLEAKDCLGLDVNRVSGQNTNILLLFAKLKYK